MAEQDVREREKLIQFAGEANLLQYRDSIFPKDLQDTNPDHFSVDNAAQWIVPSTFRNWLTRKLQAEQLQSPDTPPPVKNEIESDDDTIEIVDFTPKARSTASKYVKLEKIQSTSVIGKKRKRATLGPSEIIEISSDDSSDEAPMTKKRGKGKKKARPPSQERSKTQRLPQERIKITRQLHVDEIVPMDSIPSCWTVPSPDCDVAYLLDIRSEKREWKDAHGELVSMSGIIKLQDQDAWKGTAGSLAKPTTMGDILDGIECQRSSYSCQGIYHCDQLDPTLLEGCERYAPDIQDREELWEAERAVNMKEGSTVHVLVAAFYNRVQAMTCKYEDVKGVVCDGVASLRKLDKKNLDGQMYWIGCSGHQFAPGKGHLAVSIPPNMDGELLAQLFQNKGRFVSPDNISNPTCNTVNTGMCAFVTAPRNGAKGRRTCPYTHVYNGNVMEGKLVQRQCPATLVIYSPIDRTDHRAIVLLKNAHNHPVPPSTKVSREGREKYEEAIKTVGLRGTTVMKVDRAESTRSILGGKDPASCDPALANTRVKRDIVRRLKSVEAPHGTGIQAVYELCKKQQAELPLEKRYIHEVRTQNGIEMVISMLQSLANTVHTVYATLHDNTYKRLHDKKWKEWEVVVWDIRLNLRLTIARIYCTHETRSAYKLMWTGLWDTFARVTGNPVKFHFLHGTGLRAILVDGNKPQVEACGDDLVERGNAVGFPEKHASEIVQNIIRTCDVHLDRFFNNLADHVPQGVMNQVRGFPHLETQAELDDFKKFCKESPHKKLRDWYIDKAGHSWFFPSVMKYFTKIPQESWYLTPGDTNLNESAHPFTNQFTGINLSLLDAIQGAHELDLQMEEKVQLAERNHILPRHRNTLQNRMHNGILRRQATSRKKAQRESDIDLADDIDRQLREEADARRESNARTHELREKKKTLQAVTGIRKRRQAGKAIKGKIANIPDGDDSSSSEEENAVPSTNDMPNGDWERLSAELPSQDDDWELEYIQGAQSASVLPSPHTPQAQPPSQGNDWELEYTQGAQSTSMLPSPRTPQQHHAQASSQAKLPASTSQIRTPQRINHTNPTSFSPHFWEDDLLNLQYCATPIITPRRRPPCTDADGFIIAQLLSFPPQY